MSGAHPRDLRSTDLLPLGLGIGALVVGTAFGWDARLVDAIVDPPLAVRAALVGGATVVGIAILLAAVRRLGAQAAGGQPDVRSMVRGVRLAFLAVAAFAAAVGWILAHPLPIVIALVIAGVDIIETGFLLLVVGRRATQPR